MTEYNAICPVGVILPYGAATAPAGWLIADGSAISRTTYGDLFAVYGTTHGAGDGSTTFNLPDGRGRTMVGYAPSGGHADVSTIGANDGVAVAFRRPKHRTSMSDPSHRHFGPPKGGQSGPLTEGWGAAGSAINNWQNDAAPTGITVGTNNANDVLDAPAYLVVNHIVKT